MLPFGVIAKRFYSRKRLLTLFLYLWECLLLPFIINQTIIRYQHIRYHQKLALILASIVVILPHFIMFIIHNGTFLNRIPDIPTNKEKSRSLRRGWLVYGNTILDFLFHWLLFNYCNQFLRVRNAERSLLQSHLFSNYIFDFFIPCFVIEIIYDFIYFWWHYYGHKSKFMWKYIHSTHHEIKYPSYWDVYHMSMWETWFLRLSITVLHFQFGLAKRRLVSVVMIQYFILFIEFVGHSGCELSASDVSFSRFLTSKCKWIGIDVVHHDWHHQLGGTNYCKRLGIWDRVFGTFYDPQKTENAKDQQQQKDEEEECEETKCCDCA